MSTANQSEFLNLPEALELCDFAALGDDLASSGDEDESSLKKQRVSSVPEDSLSAAEKAERRQAARASCHAKAIAQCPPTRSGPPMFSHPLPG